MHPDKAASGLLVVYVDFTYVFVVYIFGYFIDQAGVFDD